MPLTLTAGVPAAGVAREVEPRALVLFGARWCAPCMGEYADLAQITAAAAPGPVLLAWTDRAIAPPRGLSPTLAVQVRSLPVDVARRLALRLGGEGYGLPMAAMLDADGRDCALMRAPVGPAEIRAMLRRCER